MRPTLSPSTIIGYEKARRSAFPDLMATPLSRVNAERVQEAINAEVFRPNGKNGAAISAKTIKNEWGLVSAALAKLAGLRFSPRLPSYQVAPKRLPDPAAVMAAVRGSDVELPVLLALCLSLTISEVRGLLCSDIEDGVLMVRRVVIDTADGPVVKNTGKTATRLRTLVLPPFLMDIIKRSEAWINYVENGHDGLLEPRHRSVIYKHFKRDMAAAGLSLTFHNLRALNASAMLALGVPDKYAMERGGWKTPDVMKRHYQQTLDAERRKADALVDGYFSALYTSAKK